MPLCSPEPPQLLLIYGSMFTAQLNDYVFVSCSCQDDIMRLQRAEVLMCSLKLYKAVLMNADDGVLRLVFVTSVVSS